MTTQNKIAKRSYGRKAVLAFVAAAAVAVGGLAAPAPAEAGPGGATIDLSLCSSPATVLEHCVENTGIAVAAGYSYAPANLKADTVDLGGPRKGADRIDLSGCDSPATVLENCVD